MDADESRRIQPLFEPGDGLQQQIGPRCVICADMQADIIALGIDLANFGSGDADELGAVRDPQFLEPRAFGRFTVTAPGDGARYRAFEPFGFDRFEHVIDRIEIEGLDRVIVMCGDEDHRRALRLLRQ